MGCGVNHQPQSSAVVKEKAELYLYKCIITKEETKTLTFIESILLKITKFFTEQKLELVANIA
jgi:hypothetical protein